MRPSPQYAITSSPGTLCVGVGAECRFPVVRRGLPYVEWVGVRFRFTGQGVDRRVGHGSADRAPQWRTSPSSSASRRIRSAVASMRSASRANIAASGMPSGAMHCSAPSTCCSIESSRSDLLGTGAVPPASSAIGAGRARPLRSKHFAALLGPDHGQAKGVCRASDPTLFLPLLALSLHANPCRVERDEFRRRALLAVIEDQSCESLADRERSRGAAFAFALGAHPRDRHSMRAHGRRREVCEHAR